jgi:hypothetical protein
VDEAGRDSTPVVFVSDVAFSTNEVVGVGCLSVAFGKLGVGGAGVHVFEELNSRLTILPDP